MQAESETVVHPEVMRYLDHARQQLGLARDELRVLDYGCGDGAAVRILREQGYDAAGADIWAEGIAQGRASLDAAGMDGERLLVVIPEDGRTPFPDGAFHFVFSQQVFEHVQDLDIVGRELRRVTVTGGLGFHVFPPRRRPQEGHFFMPLVHWLPKNRLRWLAIQVYAHLGFGLHPPEIPGAGPRERANFLYRYSANETFYRSHQVISDTLRRAGFDVCFVVTNHRRLRANRVLARALDLRPMRSVAEWGLMTFVAMNLMTRVPADDAHEHLRVDNWTGVWQPAR